MKKIYTYILVYIVAMMLFTACSGDDVITEQGGGQPIAFDLSTANQTRADGDVGLSSYVNDFRIFCINGNVESGNFTPYLTDLMTNWVVWNETNTTSSPTNTRSWEYVGNYVGSSSDGTKSNISGGTSSQQIRYWDSNQSHYIFWALAKADRGTFTYNSATQQITTTIDLSNPRTAFYAQPVVVANANYGTPVKLVFSRFFAQLRVGFYETIPGYVVKDLKFYATSDATSPNEGEVILLGSFSSSTSATITSDVSLASTNTIAYNDNTTTSSQSFGTLNYGSVQENLITADAYLNLSSTAPTYATNTPYVISGTTRPITIKCDYTLVANDHASDNEEIHVTGATATVPIEYCNWQPNYVYTYVFKISEDTSGQTGAGYAGLYPITFDAEASSQTEWTKTYELKK